MRLNKIERRSARESEEVKKFFGADERERERKKNRRGALRRTARVETSSLKQSLRRFGDPYPSEEAAESSIPRPWPPTRWPSFPRCGSVFRRVPEESIENPHTPRSVCNRICIATDDPYSRSSQRYTSNGGGPSVLRSSLFPLALPGLPLERSVPVPRRFAVPRCRPPPVPSRPRFFGSRTATARTRPHRERRQSHAIRSCADALCKPVTRFRPASTYSQSSIRCSRDRCVAGPGRIQRYIYSRIPLSRAFTQPW